MNDTLDIASLFKFLAAQLADAQPDDPVGFIEGALHSIKNVSFDHMVYSTYYKRIEHPTREYERHWDAYSPLNPAA